MMSELCVINDKTFNCGNLLISSHWGNYEINVLYNNAYKEVCRIDFILERSINNQIIRLEKISKDIVNGNDLLGITNVISNLKSVKKEIYSRNYQTKVLKELNAISVESINTLERSFKYWNNTTEVVVEDVHSALLHITDLIGQMENIIPMAG